MSHGLHYIPLYDGNGNLYAVMLSAELWRKGKRRLLPIVETLVDELEPKEALEPLHEWEEFCSMWDFRYPLEPSVVCKHCGASTDDWRQDPKKPFLLKSAHWGGLVVFTCCNCRATVRKKHFKDHYCFEATPHTED